MVLQSRDMPKWSIERPIGHSRFQETAPKQELRIGRTSDQIEPKSAPIVTGGSTSSIPDSARLVGDQLGTSGCGQIPAGANRPPLQI